MKEKLRDKKELLLGNHNGKVVWNMRVVLAFLTRLFYSNILSEKLTIL